MSAISPTRPSGNARRCSSTTLISQSGIGLPQETIGALFAPSAARRTTPRASSGVGVADDHGGGGAAGGGHREGVLGHRVADPERLPLEAVPAEALVERLVAPRADRLGAVGEAAHRAEVHALDLGVLDPAREEVVGEVRLPRERAPVVADEAQEARRGVDPGEGIDRGHRHRARAAA